MPCSEESVPARRCSSALTFGVGVFCDEWTPRKWDAWSVALDAGRPGAAARRLQGQWQRQHFGCRSLIWSRGHYCRHPPSVRFSVRWCIPPNLTHLSSANSLLSPLRSSIPPSRLSRFYRFSVTPSPPRRSFKHQTPGRSPALHHRVVPFICLYSNRQYAADKRTTNAASPPGPKPHARHIPPRASAVHNHKTRAFRQLELAPDSDFHTPAHTST